MRNFLLTLMVGICVLSMAGCGGPAEEAAAPAPPAPIEPVGPPEEVHAEEPAEAPGEGAAAEDADGLAGTTWKMGDYMVEFQDESSVLIKGGQIATLMPDGAMGEYKVEDGNFSVSILGMTRSGTWDGEKLIVDGTEAIQQ